MNFSADVISLTKFETTFKKILSISQLQCVPLTNL